VAVALSAVAAVLVAGIFREQVDKEADKAAAIICTLYFLLGCATALAVRSTSADAVSTNAMQYEGSAVVFEPAPSFKAFFFWHGLRPSMILVLAAVPCSALIKYVHLYACTTRC
jgi:hypothetical protein